MYKKATKGNGIESRTGNLAILAKMLDKEPTKSSCNKKEKWFRRTIHKAESENNSTFTACGPDSMEQIKIEELYAYFTDKLDFYQQEK